MQLSFAKLSHADSSSSTAATYSAIMTKSSVYEKLFMSTLAIKQTSSVWLRL